jgi:ribonuclease P/MRP protein subunit RPP40
VYDVVTIDFRKAFDVIPHDRLVSKLASLGICSQTIRWVAAFLSDRSQRVNVNGAYSSSSSVSSGVIQGSVLGPVLFTLYINDLPMHCPNCTVKLFADDVKVYKLITTPDDRLTLQTSLDLICQWADVNKLDLSVEKCSYLQVGYTNLVLNYKLNSEFISPSDSITDLGICVHSSLKSGPHCSSIVSRASARARLILKTFLSRNVRLLTRAFTVYVRPLLEYCTPVWSPHYKKDVDLVENVQRTFTRKLFFICHLPATSYDNRLHFLGLQRLELRRIHFDLIYMFKLTHNLTLSSLSNTLCFTNNSTRGHKYKLHIQRCNKSVFSTYFTNRVAPVWNYLPVRIFCNDTLNAFKRNLPSVDFTGFLHDND